MPKGNVAHAAKETDETQPLVDAKTRASWGYWWSSRATDTFKFAATYSVRVAFWTMMIAAIPLSFAYGRKKFSDYGFNMAYIVCNFLFIIGPNLGTTVQTSMYGLLGNFWAGLTLYVLNGFYPGGSQGHLDTAFFVGCAVSMVYLLAFMYLNVNGSVQFFALYGYVGYAMTFLNPTMSNNVSKAFTLDYKGAAVNALILYAIGVFFAIVCALLPWPVLARHLMTDQVGKSLAEVDDLYRQIIDYYSGATSNMRIYELMSNVQGVRRRLESAKAAIAASWWECFGIGSHATSRQMMKQFCDSLEQVMSHLDPLIGVVAREGFESTHSQVTGKIQKEFLDVVDKTLKLLKFNFEITIDGTLSPNEQAILETDLRELEASMAALDETFRSVCREISTEPITLSLTGEHYFVYMANRIAEQVQKRSKGLLEKDHPDETTSIISAVTSDIKGLVDPAVLFDGTHIMWVFRNTLSLLLCFWLGFFGWGPIGTTLDCTKPGRSCFIRPYNSGMATLVIVLLSKFVGSTFKNALDRLTAVVLANVIGQLGYVLVGWCTMWGRCVTGVLVFVIVQPNMYVAYGGGSYASLGMRLAAIGAMSLLTPCSDSYVSKSEYADQYHAISDIVIGASIIMMVDMIFGGKPASSLGKRALDKAITDFKSLHTDMQRKNHPPAKELYARLSSVEANLDEASSLSEDARKEPRFWRQQWRVSFVATTTDAFRHLCKLQHLVIHIVYNDKPECKDLKIMLESLEKWPMIVSEIGSCLDFTVDLALYILHMNRPEEISGLSKLLSQSTDETLPIDELLDEMNKKRKITQMTPRSGDTLTARLSISIETIFSFMHRLRKAQHQMVLNKNF